MPLHIAKGHIEPGNVAIMVNPKEKRVVYRIVLYHMDKTKG